MASISYLPLDSTYDPVFSDGASLTGVQAVSQAILTRLKLFYGEWWEDLTLGLPVFQSMLGQLASKKGIAAMQLAIVQNVEGLTAYVTAVQDVQVSFTNGRFAFTATVQTVFGTVTVSSGLPGAAASLET